MSVLRWTLNDLKNEEAKGPRFGPINLAAQSRVSDNISTSNLTSPIVTFTAENTFTMDISANETYEVPFERTNDMEDGNYVEYEEEGIIKKRTMNNMEWMTAMRKRVDQWQAHHDGYNLSCPGNQNVPAISQNGYIRSFSTTYKCGEPEHISGTLSFQSGSMRCKNERVLLSGENAAIVRRGYGLSVDFLKSTVQITSSDNRDSYTIYCNVDNIEHPELSGSYGCVSSYTLTYGPTDPFPCLKLVLSKKRLANIAPKLIDDFIPGKNRITVSACGEGSFIVTKCSMNSQKYTLTAYAVEEAYRGITIGDDNKFPDGISLKLSPLEIIKAVLNKDYNVGGLYTLHVDKESTFITNATDIYWKKATDDTGKYLRFPKECTVWYIISVCAARLNCSVWFADGYFYLIDLSKESEQTNQHTHRFNKTIYLNAVPNSPFDDESSEAKETLTFIESVQDNPTLGDEGLDTLSNEIVIVKGDKQITTENTWRPAESRKKYGLRSGNKYMINELDIQDLQIIANNLASHTSDVQQSITFTVTELGDETDSDGTIVTRWRSYFPQFSQVNEIVDHNTDSLITNRATWDKGKMLYDKLSLSSVTRKFPEFSSEYTFGRIANTDLAQTTSVIQQAIGNK